MDNKKFENAITSVRDYTKIIHKASTDDTELVRQLNLISTNSRVQLFNRYKEESGIIKEIRKSVSEILKDRNITVEEIATIIDKAKLKNPKSFKSFYKSIFSIFYIFLMSDFKIDLGKKLVLISNFIISELNGNNFLHSKIFDFSGEMENGATNCWIAIINNKQLNQKFAKQLFLEFNNGDIIYSFFDFPKKIQYDKVNVKSGEELSVENLINTYKKHYNEILADIPSEVAIEEIKIKPNENIYKISMSKRDIDDKSFNYFKDNCYVVMHKDTNAMTTSKQTQGETFTKQIKLGDYFYLCRGNQFSVCIGKIISTAEKCDYEEWGDRGWVQRKFEIVKESVLKERYKGILKWWTPNSNTTCIKIPEDEIALSNKMIFEPIFKVKLNYEKVNETILEENIKGRIPLNKVLFGPPGTGKTYYTVNKALEIVDPIFYEENKNEREKLVIRFRELLFNFENDEGQIGFITFHQSMSYEDFIEGIKPLPPDETNNIMLYDIVEGLFKRICIAAQSKEGNFNEMIKWLKDQSSEMEGKNPITIQNNKTKFKVSYRGGKTFRIKPEMSQRTDSDYPASIENIRKVYEGASRADVYNPTYVIGILEHLFSNGLQKYTEIQDSPKNYVLIIDEINRGNVSQIFGELISLIEEDKRIGKSENIEVTLPYSKKKFSVPNNLYIIGTMNTADKSVEALDTALRRRFSFEEISPEYSLKELKYSVFKFQAFEILEVLNNRIEKLLDKDHLIGHSFFIFKDDKGKEILDNNTLLEKVRESFYENIIPLLQEYFFGDYGKIGLILGSGFVRRKEWNKNENEFAGFKYESLEEYSNREVFEIIKISSNEMQKFEEALNSLMNKVDQ